MTSQPSTEQTQSRTVRNIEKTLARVADELPALAAVLKAFGPMLAEQARLRESAPGWAGPLPAVNGDRFAQGVFVLAQMEQGEGFQDMSAHLPAAAAKLLPVMAASFPALAGELEELLKAVQTGALAPQALAAAGFGEAVDPVPDVSAETLAFAAGELVRPFVERQARDLAAHVAELPWRQAMCPVCGCAPGMSMLRPVREESEFIQAHGGKRYLCCSSCGVEWAHKRVSCVSCGCEDPDELLVLRAPERPFERVDACRRCKTFLLCLDTAEMVEVPDAEAAALGMLPLEMKAREQGFAPLGLHPWSRL